MTWTLLFLLLWMSFRMILSIGHSADSAVDRPHHQIDSVHPVNGGLKTLSTGDDDG